MLKKMIAALLMLSLAFPLVSQGKAGHRIGGGGHSGGYSRGFSDHHQGYTRPSPTRGYQSSTPYNHTYGATPQTQTRSSSGSFLGGAATGVAGSWLYNKLMNGENTATKTDQATNTTAKALPNQSQPREEGRFLRTILLLGAAFLLWRYFKKRRKNSDDISSMTPNTPQSPAKSALEKLLSGGLMTEASNQAPATQEITQQDYAAFETILTEIQSAWSMKDLSTLQNLTTPQIFETFSSLLQENQARNVSNTVSNVKLLNQNLQDTWEDGGKTFARVALTWRAIDYSVNNGLPANDPGYLIEGSLSEPATTSEIWTFQRNGNSWLLAGIEQV